MAKLRLEQLDAALKKRINPVYLVTGDEALLVQEACDAIRSAARKQGFLERELYHTDAGFQWDYLANSASAMSLFADKKIIEIRVHNGKPGDAGSKALLEYCQSINEETLLLLVLPKIDKRSQNSKWYKALEKAGDIITIWPISVQQLPRWINQRLNAAGLNADNQAIDILTAKVEGNLLAAAQEIEKLKLVANDQYIDAATMSDAVTTSARYDVFGLVDKAMLGNSRAATESLQGLRGEGTEPAIILWALSREIRTLALIKESIDNGKSFDFAAKSHGVWDSKKALVKQAIHRLSLKQLHSLNRKASNTDKSIKGIVKSDVWNQLMDMTLCLSGTQALNERSSRLSMQIKKWR